MASIFIEREVRSYPSVQYAHPGLTQHLIQGATDHSSSVDSSGRHHQQQQNGSSERGQSRELRRSVSDEALHLKTGTHSTNWKASNKTKCVVGRDQQPAGAGDSKAAAQHRTVARLVRTDSLSTSCPDLSKQHTTHGVRSKPLVAANGIDAVGHSRVQPHHHPEERTTRFPAISSHQLQTSQTSSTAAASLSASQRQQQQQQMIAQNNKQLTPSPLARRKQAAPGHMTATREIESDRRHHQKASDDAPAHSLNIKSHVASSSPSRRCVDARSVVTSSPQRLRQTTTSSQPQQHAKMTSPQRQQQTQRKADASSTQRQMLQPQNAEDEEDLDDEVFEKCDVWVRDVKQLTAQK